MLSLQSGATYESQVITAVLNRSETSPLFLLNWASRRHTLIISTAGTGDRPSEGHTRTKHTRAHTQRVQEVFITLYSPLVCRSLIPKMFKIWFLFCLCVGEWILLQAYTFGLDCFFVFFYTFSSFGVGLLLYSINVECIPIKHILSGCYTINWDNYSTFRALSMLPLRPGQLRIQMTTYRSLVAFPHYNERTDI